MAETHRIRLTEQSGFDKIEHKFLPARVLNIIYEAVLWGTAADLTAIVNGLVLYGLTQDQAMNQIRFSFCCGIPNFANAYSVLPECPELKLLEVDDTLKALICKALEIQSSPRSPQCLFRFQVDVDVAIMLSVYMNAKEFNAENYDKTIEKRVKAYYRKRQSEYSESFTRIYLNALFSKETVKHYHDYLPKCVRKILYQCAKEMELSSMKNYLLDTLMAYNGMCLVKETFNVLYGPARRFMDMERYTPDIKLFSAWYDNHKSDPDFKYFWYVRPELIYQVSQAKCVNLYSAVLKNQRMLGLMIGYKSKTLVPDSVPPEDLAEVSDSDGE